MLGNISPLSLLLILLIVLLLFGGKRLRNIGSDLGAAISSFRKGMQAAEDEKKDKKADDDLS